MARRRWSNASRVVVGCGSERMGESDDGVGELAKFGGRRREEGGGAGGRAGLGTLGRLEVHGSTDWGDGVLLVYE